MFKKILFILFIIIISGLSGIFADRYFFPRLATSNFFSKYEFLKKSAENITIINKTEQVYIKEEYSVGKFSNQNLSAIVNILFYSDKDNIVTKNNYINGTGAILTSDGIIITHNNNLINEKVKITSIDGNSYDGKLIGVDSWSNLAFIKIEASNLPVISFANSDEYKAGEKIILISNNLEEYQNEFMAGILKSFNPFYNISGEAFSRAEKLEGIFLADLENKNISAGSLAADYSGQIIGIAGVSKKNGQDEYFIIPSNKIKNVIKKVIDKSFEQNPILGAYYISLSKSFAMANNLEADQGSLIYSSSGQQGLSVISGSPAAKSGLKINDIIVKINDEEVTPVNNLSDILYKYKKGDLLEFMVFRNKEEKKIQVQM